MGINRVDKGSVGTFSVTSLLIFFSFVFFFSSSRMKLIYLIGLLLSTHLIQQGKAVENATSTTKTSIQNKYTVTEDAEENKKIIVIEKQSKAADQKSAKEEALTAKTGGLEQLIVKAQSTWRAKAAYGPTVYYTDKVEEYPVKCVWNSGSLEVWANSGKNIEEAEKCCRYLKEIKIYRCIWRVDQKKTFRDAQKMEWGIWRHSGASRIMTGKYLDICF